jgi:predicted nucleotide-binding protein
VTKILDQQFVAHIFAPAEGPGAADAHGALTQIWEGCRLMFGMTQPVPEFSLPQGMPTYEAITVGGESALATQERPRANCQAIVRLHHDVLNLSVGIALPDATGDQPWWPTLDFQWNMLVAGHARHLLGEARLYLAEVEAEAGIRDASPALYTSLSPLLPAGATGPSGPSAGVAAFPGTALWETSTQPDDRALRRFLLPFTPDADPVASAWAWSRGDLAIPPLARYLLHAAKLRYELRVLHSGGKARRMLLSDLGSLADEFQAGRPGDPEKEAQLGLLRRGADLLHTELRILRRTVEIATDNLGQALDLTSLLAQGTPFADDVSLGSHLLKQLDDEIDYLGLAAERADLLAGGRRPGSLAEPVTQDQPSAQAEPASDPGSRRNVFVVYGRDDQARRAVFHFLRALDLRPLEWEALVRGTGNTAPFLREVVLQGIELAPAVVVLMTPEDVVHLHPDLHEEREKETEVKNTLQARPNVLLELGMALAAKPEGTVVLMVGDHRPVTDLGGINFITLEDTVACRVKIAGRLKQAGCAVDDGGNDWLRAGDFGSLAAVHRTVSTESPGVSYEQREGSTAPSCYVSIPSGIKSGPDGNAIDFDDLYTRAILPVTESLGLVARRADALETIGAIQKGILEAVLGADFMIADISFRNANALYELGIRHTARPAGTIVISCDDEPPSDLRSAHVLKYQPPSRNGNDLSPSILELSEMLDRALRSAMKGRIDSPVHELFPTLSVSLPNTIPGRGPANFLRMRLLNAQRLPETDALDEIRAVEEAIYRDAGQDRTLLEDLMLAYRDQSAWAEMIRVTNRFPPDLRHEPTVAQQVALALNRSGQREAAERELTALIERTGGDSETYGILGRIFKDRWLETSERRDLGRAIDAYRRGYEHDRTDYYPGINLATLLTVRGDAPDRDELRHLVPGLRQTLDDRAASGPTDYWQLATRLELAVLAGDYPAAEDLLEHVLARAAASWMLESTAGNLRFIAEARAIDAGPRLQAIIDRLQVTGERP